MYDLRIVVGQEFAFRCRFFRDETIEYFYLWGNKNEVDFLALLRRDLSEVVEGVVYSHLFAGNLSRIFQYECVGSNGAVSFRLVVYVEVARQYCGAVAYYFFYFPDNQQSAFPSGSNMC